MPPHVRVLLGWLLVLVAGTAAAVPTIGALTDTTTRTDNESGRASRLLAGGAPTGARLVGVVPGPVDDPGLRDAVSGTAALLRTTPGVAEVLDYPDSLAGVRFLADAAGMAQLVVVDLQPRLTPAAYSSALQAVQDRLHATDTRGAGPVVVGGAALLREQAAAGARRDLARAEVVTLPVALLVLVLVFGGFVAALLPLLTAVATAAGAVLLVFAATRVTPVSSFTVNVVTMFGLGLAIDYGLLVLTRYREERAAGADTPESVRRAGATAGRTVTFSGLTIAVALSGLLVFGDGTLTSLAVGGMAATATAVVAGRTLLPALLLVLGDRIRPGRPLGDTGAFARLARAVARRPLVVAVAVTAGLLLAAVPVLHLTVRHADYRTLPASSEARRAAARIDSDFPGRVASPVTVVVGSRSTAATTFAASLLALPSMDGAGVVGAVPHPNTPAGLIATDLVAAGEGQGPQAQDLVRRLRAGRPAGLAVAVTGDAAYLIDHRAQLAARLPLAAAVTLLATFALLFAFTGSVVVPVKAVLVAALSLTASVGALVWGFQDGHLSWLFGGGATGALQLEVPLVVVVFAFGLSLDYEVFLLGRVKEAYDAGAAPGDAVAVGLQRTGRVVTSAALLITVVFLGFATGDTLLVQQLGVGLTVAVLADATVVRCLLVPAAMALLGRANWWAPAPLARWHALVVAGNGTTRAADCRTLVAGALREAGMLPPG